MKRHQIQLRIKTQSPGLISIVVLKTLRVCDNQYNKKS